MLRNLTLLTLIVALLAGCINKTSPNKASSFDNGHKLNTVKQPIVTVPLTDSAKLVKRLDSLPKVTFPYNGNGTELSKGVSSINLGEFKKKNLLHRSYRLVPRSIGGSMIDDREQVDSTFNLCDTNYRASWVLVTMTPKFFAVEVSSNYSLLVTLDYHMNVIDAIHIATSDPSSNDNFQGELSSTIYRNLKIVMHYTYYIRTDAQHHFDKTSENDICRIDRNGHFKAIRYRPDGVNHD